MGKSSAIIAPNLVKISFVQFSTDNVESNEIDGKGGLPYNPGGCLTM